ncbi:hypothetical protein P8629_12430, partial [Hydrogenovibrio sp. 3SP14C1]|uniref:hypothetical protein n=1 Tax=Hydrogenovibrio sp. 3SP14C1 TaxID=3038774 RepID=UPI002417BBAE
EMVKEVKIFAIAAHADHFGERLAKMNALPKGWLPEYDRMEGVCYKDEHFVICYNGNVRLLYVSHASQFIFHKYKNEENSGAKY